MNKLAATAVSEGMIPARERTQFARAVSNWLGSSEAKSAAQAPQSQGPVSTRINEVLSGGCAKAWS